MAHFAVALPVSILTYLVLICVFKRTKHLRTVVALFVLSLFLTVYLLFHHANPWQIFLVAILAEALAEGKQRKTPGKSVIPQIVE